jgi:ribosomal protein S18 acetylase RimI-like enzyme
MGLGFWKEKAILYYRKNGFWSSLKQLFVKIHKAMFPEPDIIYYADLVGLPAKESAGPDAIRIVERKTAAEITAEEREVLFDQIGKKLIEPQLTERFARGASAWFVYWKEQFAGMVWTLAGDTMEPFYYFIPPQDVHVFNNVIFPAYRGKGINPVLIETVLARLSERGYVRAYIETLVSNLAERKSLARTRFRPMGIARKKKYGDRQITCWSTKLPGKDGGGGTS